MRSSKFHRGVNRLWVFVTNGHFSHFSVGSADALSLIGRALRVSGWGFPPSLVFQVGSWALFCMSAPPHPHPVSPCVQARQPLYPCLPGLVSFLRS